jgi:hypothetical protein
MQPSAMARVALLGSPKSFAANNSNFSGAARKTLVLPSQTTVAWLVRSPL